MFEVWRGKREPMSKVDTAWLRMERPTNLMMITGVLMFDDALEVDRFKQLLASRFLAYRRFRQRAVDTMRAAFWEFDEDFDLNWHVRRTALPGKADLPELEELVSQLSSTPLDKTKPLWQFHVVEKYRGGSALIARVHHCYADGIALVQVLLSLTDAARDAEHINDPVLTSLRREVGVLERLLEPARQGWDSAMALGGKAWEKAMEWAKEPSHASQQAGWLARESGEIVRELANALSLPDDPPTMLKGPLGVSKRVAWAAPLPLEEVKTVGKALGCTVNDVLLACAAGALRGYMRSRGEDIDGLSVRATVPVNLRPLEHAKKLGNHFGLVFLDLPIGLDNPLARLQAVAECMHKLKTSRQAMVSLGLLAALGMGPSSLQRPALELFSRKATAVATNVPGPQTELFMAGARIRELMFWVPQTGSIGIGLSILSYNGKVFFGLIADRKLIEDPDEIVERFAAEFEKLVFATLMEDWDHVITAADVRQTLHHHVSGAGDADAGPRPSAARKPRPAAKRTARAPKAGNGSAPHEPVATRKPVTLAAVTPVPTVPTVLPSRIKVRLKSRGPVGDG